MDLAHVFDLSARKTSIEKVIQKIFDFYSNERGNGVFEKVEDLNNIADVTIAKLYQTILDSEELEKLREAGIDNNTKVINYCFSCGTKLNGG